MAAAKKSRKKKEEVQEQSVVAPEAPSLPFKLEGPAYQEGCVHLSPNDLLRYELLQEKFKSALQDIGLAMAEKERVINYANKEIERIQKEAHAKVAELDHRILQAQGVSKSRERELDVFRKALGESYALDFTKVSYDDTSGKLFVVDETGNTEPVTSEKK